MSTDFLPPPPSESNDCAFLGAANALPGETLANGGLSSAASAQPDSAWLKLADYGDWPHPSGLQRLTRRAAGEMSRAFKSLLGRLRRRFAGVPVYIGHPDDPGFAGSPGHSDTRAYAWVSDLEARADGLYMLPRWSAPGRALLQNAHYKFLSPRWQMRPLAHGLFEPIRLLSIGLTNHPNIPGEAVANQFPLPPSPERTVVRSPSESLAKEVPPPHQPETQNSNPETLSPPSPLPDSFLNNLLTALDLDPTAAPATTLANAENLAEAARQTRDAQLESTRFYRLATDADTARQAAERRTDEERAARIELLLELALNQRRITPTQRNHWREQLTADFDHAQPALANTLLSTTVAEPETPNPELETHVLTSRLSSRRPHAPTSPPADRLLTLVNERIARTGEDYSTAWARLRRARPELFTASH